MIPFPVFGLATFRILLFVGPVVLAFAVGFHTGAVKVQYHMEREARLLEQKISRLETTHATEQARLSDTIRELETRLSQEASDDPDADHIAIDADGVHRIGEIHADED